MIDAEVIVQVADLIKAYPRLALRAPERQCVYTMPFTTGYYADLVPAIAKMARGLYFVQSTETVPGPSLRIICKSAAETGLWP